MSFLYQWSPVASFGSLARPSIALRCSPVHYSLPRRSSSFSAVWRGLRNEKSGRQSAGRRPPAAAAAAAPRTAPSRQPRPRSLDVFDSKFSAAVGTESEGRRHYKPKKALKKAREREEEDEGGRKSRSKRFNEPEYSFGKKSLVYQLNRGGLKDKISKLVETRRAESPPRRPDAPEASNFGERPTFDQRNMRPRGDRSSRERERFSSRNGRNSRPSEMASQEVREELEADGEGRHRQESRGRDSRGTNFAATLPYTTAASQFLYGRWPVTAALKEAKRKLYRLYVYAGSNRKDAFDSIRSLAEKRHVRVTTVPESKQHLLDNMSRGRPHNGLVLEASPLPQLPLNSLGEVSQKGYSVDIARQSKEEENINGSNPFQSWQGRGAHKPLVILLHEVMDPGNLGAMLRTARFLGAAAVAITKQTSSPLTSTVVKAAAGAAEELTIFSVADPIAFLDASKDAGWESFVAVAPAARQSTRRQMTAEEVADEDPLRVKPCILVLGNEGEGLSRRMVSRADHQVTIARQPSGASSVDSLNVSVAAALLCDAFTRGARAMPRTFEQKLKQDAKKAQSGDSLF